MSLDRVTDEILALLREIEGRAEPLPCTDEILLLLHEIIDGEAAPTTRPAPVVAESSPPPAPRRVVQWEPLRPTLPLGEPVARFFGAVAWDGSGPSAAPARVESPTYAAAAPRAISVQRFFAAIRWDGAGAPGSFPPEIEIGHAVRVPPPAASGDAVSVHSFFGSVRWEGASATPS